MSNYNVPVVVVDNPNPIVMQVAVQRDIGFSMGEQSIVVENDYNRLHNKPRISGREIIGDRSVAYYLQDGLILDGGDAQEVG